jgi:hypothetical protein
MRDVDTLTDLLDLVADHDAPTSAQARPGRRTVEWARACGLVRGNDR